MQHDNFDEKDSLRRVEQGDEVAARELLRHFHPFVLRLVRAHLPRRISEEDLVQMIFIKSFTNSTSTVGACRSSIGFPALRSTPVSTR